MKGETWRERKLTKLWKRGKSFLIMNKKNEIILEGRISKPSSNTESRKVFMSWKIILNVCTGLSVNIIC